SYLCFAPGGVNRPIPQTSRTTTQTFFAATDLDIMPAGNSSQKLPQRIYCAKNSKISLKLSAHLPVSATLLATVSSPDGAAISRQRIGLEPEISFGRTTAQGWHTVFVEGSGLPETGIDYKLEITYSGVER